MLFSVIIPTRNRPEFLGDAVASVLAQLGANFELIIVNDGDTPVENFGDERITVISSAGAGAVPARNLGVATARGSIIAFLDDDDKWCDRRFLAVTQTVFESGADFVFADGEFNFPDGRAPTPFAHDADAKTLSRDNTILISAVCYRRGLHDVLGHFDEDLPYYWDWDWYLRVARAGKNLTHFNRNVVQIRIHVSNMSGNANAGQRQMNLERFAKKHALGELTLKSHLDF